MNCPACAAKRLHEPSDWALHPYAGHGFQKGQGWSHPDLGKQTLLTSIITLRDSIEAEKGILPEMAKEDCLT